MKSENNKIEKELKEDDIHFGIEELEIANNDNSIQFIRLVVSEDGTVQFKVASIGKGLTKLRWLLEKIKKR